MKKPDSPAVTAGAALTWQIAGAMCSRLTLNTARRVVYPFAPVFSRGLDVPLAAVTTLVAACQAAPLAGLVSGPLADRWGYRRMMVGGMGMLAIGMLAVAVWPTFSLLAIGLLLASFGKTVFDPAVQAYVGQRVVYHRRAQVIGLMEFSWAGSTLLTIPLIGLLIRNPWLGGRPPWCLGAVALACLWMVRHVFPAGPSGRGGTVQTSPRAAGLGTAFSASVRRWGMMGFRLLGQRGQRHGCSSSTAPGFETAFGTGGSPRWGATAMVIGSAELLGEICTAAAARIGSGLKRSAGIGLAGSAAAYALLPLVGQPV